MIFRLWWTVFGLSACVHFGGPVEEVIEKSKAKRPVWVEFTDQNLAIDPLRITFVTAGTHFLEVPLAVQETQLNALKTSEVALESRISDQIYRFASDRSIVIASVAQLNAAIAKRVKEAHTRYANVSDIYYERIRGSDPQSQFNEYIRVYVRIDFFKDKLPGMLRLIRNDLKTSSKKDLRQLSSSLGDIS